MAAGLDAGGVKPGAVEKAGEWGRGCEDLFCDRQ